MNALRKSIVIGLTVLGLGSAVLPSFAAEEGRQGHAMTEQQRAARHAEFRTKRAEHVAQRQAKLHDALKLTAAQEPAWAAYQAAIKPAGAPLARGERGDWKAMTAPQRMEKRIEMGKLRIARMEAHLAATKSLYAALSPEQQKLFDENSKRGHGKKHRGMHRGHGGHGGHGGHMGHAKAG
ncbi:MAG: Spy/CpxP family protein refolding chaperone [Telluria sp.]